MGVAGWTLFLTAILVSAIAWGLPDSMVAQVAISLPLLIGAGLFTRTLDNLRTLDRGFQHEHVLLIDVDARRTARDKPALRAFYQRPQSIRC